ncbi:hypothetical protein SAMN04487819_11483 [Actinopolyspora alba]|uniref:Uncharacterized protein n=1 Tax=Actinopolyspora alba TaxID=673379 RepID=A0A1I2ARS8_9ACTN|nr:hypothetical protein SAMN04487819_11483 [Actinopolyspora alba]
MRSGSIGIRSYTSYLTGYHRHGGFMQHSGECATPHTVQRERIPRSAISRSTELNDTDGSCDHNHRDGHCGPSSTGSVAMGHRADHAGSPVSRSREEPPDVVRYLPDVGPPGARAGGSFHRVSGSTSRPENIDEARKIQGQGHPPNDSPGPPPSRPQAPPSARSVGFRLCVTTRERTTRHPAVRSISQPAVSSISLDLIGRGEQYLPRAR